MTFTKVQLSNSVNGRGIKVAAVASPGTSIHSTPIATTTLDEMWIFAYNSDTVDHVLTIQFGGTSSPDDDIKMTIPAQSGMIGVVTGFPICGTGAAASNVLAYADAANVITINGFVNRIA